MGADAADSAEDAADEDAAKAEDADEAKDADAEALVDREAATLSWKSIIKRNFLPSAAHRKPSRWPKIKISL